MERFYTWGKYICVETTFGMMEIPSMYLLYAGTFRHYIASWLYYLHAVVIIVLINFSGWY